MSLKKKGNVNFITEYEYDILCKDAVCRKDLIC